VPVDGAVTAQRTAHRPLEDTAQGTARRLLDVTVAGAALVVLSPLLAAIALAIAAESRGPVIFRQRRLGLGRRPFTVLKFRTMSNGADAAPHREYVHSLIDQPEGVERGRLYKLSVDNRVTRVGRFLRAWSLDELPQLVNVLRGDMSLIGPRPERPEFLPELEAACPRYRGRLAVRPGVTGLAQVQLPADTSVDSVRLKLAYDLYYIRHLTPWLDLSLLICTALYAMGLPFAVTARLLRVPGGERVEGEMHGNAEEFRSVA
jgi:lipopolysaccharide/colanic/teichoic acid biosynthesis glycosyltransferase